jgi:hypothetical protein
MNAVQSLVIVILLIPVAFVMIKDYYTEQRREKAEKKQTAENVALIAEYSSMHAEEIQTQIEAAITTDNEQMEDIGDFLELILNPLTIDNLYDIAVTNYVKLPQKSRDYIMNAKTENETYQDATILQVLEDNHFVNIQSDDLPHFTVEYTVVLYLKMRNLVSSSNLKSIIGILTTAAEDAGLVVKDESKDKDKKKEVFDAQKFYKDMLGRDLIETKEVVEVGANDSKDRQ